MRSRRAAHCAAAPAACQCSASASATTFGFCTGNQWPQSSFTTRLACVTSANRSPHSGLQYGCFAPHNTSPYAVAFPSSGSHSSPIRTAERYGRSTAPSMIASTC